MAHFMLIVTGFILALELISYFLITGKGMKEKMLPGPLKKRKQSGFMALKIIHKDFQSQQAK